MAIGYKLTGHNLQTHGGFQWVIGQWAETSGGGKLCRSGWLHYSRDPLLAVLHNPIHANISDPILWEAEIAGEQLHDGWLKSGCTRMRIVGQIDLPVVTPTQDVAYGILCAKAVYFSDKFVFWADNWLNGSDRTAEAAEAAWTAAVAAWAAPGSRAAEAAAQAAMAAPGAMAVDAVAEAAAEAARTYDLHLRDIARMAMGYE